MSLLDAPDVGRKITESRLQRAGIFVPRRRAASIVVSLGVPFLAAVLGSRLLTDYLWFREVGHAGVFWRVLEWKTGVLAGVGGAVAVCLLATLRTALRRAPSKVRHCNF